MIDKSSNLTLYDHLSSSFCVQVRIALREKGIPFNSIIPSGLGTGQDRDPSWSSGNVRTQVPTLLDDGGATQVFDSTIIIEYLEDKFGRSLLPETPAERAKARQIEDVVQTTYEAINWGWAEVVWGKRGSEELQQKIKSEARRQVKVVHEWLTEQLGSQSYFNGSTFGWADVAVAPMVHRGVIYGDGMEPATNSPLAQWHARIMERLAVKQTLDEMEKGAKAMGDSYTTVFAPSRGNKREYGSHRLEFMLKAGGMSVVEEGLKEGTIRFGWPEGKSGDDV